MSDAPAPPRPSRLAWYDRSGKRLETLGEPGLYRGIELSPDGKKIAVHVHENPVGGNLWLYDLTRGTFTRFTHTPVGSLDVAAFRVGGGRTPTQLLSTRFNEGGGTLSPDGRWLAYHSDESGRFEVYVSSYPGLADKVQLSTAGGVFPRWAADGGEVFYVTEQGAVMTVSVSAGSALSAGLPRELFKADLVIADHWTQTGMLWHMPYDVAADGERFLVNEFVGEAARDSPVPPRTTIVVVPNWATTVER